MAIIKHTIKSPYWEGENSATFNTKCVDSQNNFVPSILFNVGEEINTENYISEGSSLIFESEVMRISTSQVVSIKDLMINAGWEVV